MVVGRAAEHRCAPEQKAAMTELSAVRAFQQVGLVISTAILWAEQNTDTAVTISRLKPEKIAYLTRKSSAQLSALAKKRCLI